MLMNVQLETGTFAEMASASIQWGPSSVSATTATRWLRTGGPVWVSAAASERLSGELPRDRSENHAGSVTPFLLGALRERAE